MSGQAGKMPMMPWGLQGQKIQPGSMKTISEDKLASFAVGTQKKSRFQKQREEKEAKKKQEEEETAKLFDSFVASFTEDDDSKTFVRGGRIQEGDGVYGGRSGDVYKLENRDSRKVSELTYSAFPKVIHVIL
jgi:U2-associated protein SR140